MLNIFRIISSGVHITADSSANLLSSVKVQDHRSSGATVTQVAIYVRIAIETSLQGLSNLSIDFNYLDILLYVSSLLIFLKFPLEEDHQDIASETNSEMATD